MSAVKVAYEPDVESVVEARRRLAERRYRADEDKARDERSQALAAAVASVTAERDAVKAERDRLQAKHDQLAGRLRAAGKVVPEWLDNMTAGTATYTTPQVSVSAGTHTMVQREGTKAAMYRGTVALTTEAAIWDAMEREAKAAFPKLSPAAAMTEFMAKTKRGQELYAAYDACDRVGFVPPMSAA